MMHWQGGFTNRSGPISAGEARASGELSGCRMQYTMAFATILPYPRERAALGHVETTLIL